MAHQSLVLKCALNRNSAWNEGFREEECDMQRQGTVNSCCAHLESVRSSSMTGVMTVPAELGPHSRV